MWALSLPVLVHCAMNIFCERRAIARVTRQRQRHRHHRDRVSQR